MYFKHTTLYGVVLAAITMQVEATEQNTGFLADSKVAANLPTFYFNRDKQQGPADSKAAAQALRLDFNSGYAHGLIGFDASLFTVANWMEVVARAAPAYCKTIAMDLRTAIPSSPSLLKVKAGR